MPHPGLHRVPNFRSLELTADRIDLPDKSITFRTLKQREKVKYRSVPCPDTLIDALKLTHRVRKAQIRGLKSKGKATLLWPWGRTQATKHVWAVMEAADISGDYAIPKGLSHGFRVRMAMQTRNPRLVQKLLGTPTLKRQRSTWIWLVMKHVPRLLALGDALKGSTFEAAT